MGRIVSKHVASGLCTGLLLAMSVPASAAVDAKLLEMLKANGSITAAQHSELQAELAKEQAEVTAQKTAAAKFDEKLAWATKTQFKGDVRLRQEITSTDGRNAAGVDDSGDQNRQRIRMRLGAYSQVNPEVDVGIRIASGSSDDRRSTNQTMEGFFTKKSIWMDQAYIDFHPEAVKNLHLIGGKMAQPWFSVADVIWDGDINPEGLAATYKYPLGGSAELFGSAGYYNMDDNVDGEGVEFRHDTQMYTGQLGVKFAPADKVGVTLGGSVYSFDNDKLRDSNGNGRIDLATEASALTASGNTTSEFQLWEGFGQVDFTGLAVPLSFYGQYVVNSDANDEIRVNGRDGNGGNEGDTAWLVGFKTGYGKVKFDYNYRDVERNAVVGIFTDSDFASGFTGSRGHKFKLGYDLSKNFAAGATYYMTETDGMRGFIADTDTDTLQLDLEAKF
ncbi:putative porin [Geopseudomonas aromaticivorans]